MRPTTATLGIRVTASVTLRELYGARGAGIRAIADGFLDSEFPRETLYYSSIYPAPKLDFYVRFHYYQL